MTLQANFVNCEDTPAAVHTLPAGAVVVDVLEVLVDDLEVLVDDLVLAVGLTELVVFFDEVALFRSCWVAVTSTIAVTVTVLPAAVTVHGAAGTVVVVTEPAPVTPTVTVASTIGTKEEQKADAFRATRTAEHDATSSRFTSSSAGAAIPAMAVLA